MTRIPVGVDLVSFEAGGDVGEVSFSALGSPAGSTVRAFVEAAIAKVSGRGGHVTGTLSVVSTQARVARTSDGSVAYRSLGSGPPLVLIMGYAGTMHTWDPRFVDGLAADFHVVVFDNAGVGRTELPRGSLTIDAMADQTSALVAALHLGSADVLGWSMGGMVAQALAVRHPGQVRRLVLCATFPGTGSVRPSQAAIEALTRGDTSAAMADLFPPGHTQAARMYEVATSAWESTAPAPASVVADQARAIDEWWGGKDPAGRRTRTITAPTLVVDGTQDRLVPLANDRVLARSIPWARLTLYPHSGHAFLFQDVGPVVEAVVSFLGA